MKKYRIVYWLAAVCCLPLFTACNGFLREADPRRNRLADAYRTLSDVYLNAVAFLYNYVGGYADSQGLQGTRGRGVYDLNTFTTDECHHAHLAVTGTTAASGRDCICISGE